MKFTSAFICNFAFVCILLIRAQTVAAADDSMLSWSGAVIVAQHVATESPTSPEDSATTVLTGEVKSRSGVMLAARAQWPNNGPVIALKAGLSQDLHGISAPAHQDKLPAESYRIESDFRDAKRPILWVCGADGRGLLFGVGKLLRIAVLKPGIFQLDKTISLFSSPEYAIRGHQLGYRATANSYDAWMPAQFDQYIRELALFGSNSVEGIPLHDDRPTVSSFPRNKMNVEISRICKKYGQDYWIWTPADFDLARKELRDKALMEHAEIYASCPTLTGVFVAGGDPGDNPPSLVIPYLRDLARLLAKRHPQARVWLSLQGFSLEHQDQIYQWLAKDHPAWLGGIAAGPGSPALNELRSRVPAQYPIRDYPDITHSTRCQFPVPYWDPAFAFTLGRECVNPRPVFFSRVIHDTAAFTNGFISYSDGVHDDVNKVIWSALAWDSTADLNVILTEYCRLYFGDDIAETAAAGLFAFERDWEGAARSNGSIDATFLLWSSLEARSPQLTGNWRFQLCLLRAYYDYYVRKRLIYESGLESDACSSLLTASEIGSASASSKALQILKRADSNPVATNISAKIEKLCDQLFHSIGLQTSVSKYQASGSERGCVLDFLYYPLNNRWWIEDQIARASKLSNEKEKQELLKAVATWESPGPGSYYDALGNVAKSPHEVRNEKIAGPLLDVDNMNLPGLMFWTGSDPLARSRQTWFSNEAWPTAVKYPSVDPTADYIIRTTGVGDCLLKVNGVRLEVSAAANGKKVGEIKEFRVPRLLYRDGQITVTFDPTFEPTLNWRVQSRISEIWLIKR